MNKRKFTFTKIIYLVFLVSFQFFLIGLYAQDQTGRGTYLGGLESIVQKWFLIDNSKETITISGEIKKIKKNIGHDWDDKDWNVHIKPDSQFNWCLENSRREKNSNGQIELEVKSRNTDIKSYFDTGDKVIAKGKWVEDTGHSAKNKNIPAGCLTLTSFGVEVIKKCYYGKTEIHPIDFLMKGGSIRTPNRICIYPNIDTALFMAQDASKRFYDADSITINEKFYFGEEMNGQQPHFFLPLSSNNSMNLDVDVYRETSLIKGNASVKLNHSDETLYLDVSVPPYSSGEGAAFLGNFNKKSEPLLKFTNQVILRPGTGANDDELDFRVEVELLNSGSDNFIKHWWCWQESMLDGNVVWLSTKDHNKISFAHTYAPARGLTNNIWGIYLLANSKGWNWTPNTTDSAPRKRKVVQSGGFMGFRKSSLNIDCWPVGGYHDCGFNRHGRRSIYVKNGYKIQPEKLLMDGASCTQKHWYVKILKDKDGNVITNPTYTPVISDNQMVGDFKCTFQGESLIVKFPMKTISEFLPGGTAATVTSWFSKGIILVKSRILTNFGEDLSVTTNELSIEKAGLCVDKFMEFDRGWENEIIKGLIALEKLREMGFMNPKLPFDWPSQFLTRWKNDRTAFYINVKNLGYRFRGENKNLFLAFQNYSKGKKLRLNEWKLLAKGIRLAKKLPLVKRFPLKGKTRNMRKFGNGVSPNLSSPRKIINLSKYNIRRTRTFWMEVKKRLNQKPL